MRTSCGAFANIRPERTTRGSCGWPLSSASGRISTGSRFDKIEPPDHENCRIPGYQFLRDRRLRDVYLELVSLLARPRLRERSDRGSHRSATAALPRREAPDGAVRAARTRPRPGFALSQARGTHYLRVACARHRVRGPVRHSQYPQALRHSRGAVVPASNRLPYRVALPWNRFLRGTAPSHRPDRFYILRQ